MKKKKSKIYLSIYLSIMATIMMILPINAYAYTEGQIVTKEPIEGYEPPSNYDYEIITNYNYILQDTTGVPLHGYYFKIGDGVFSYVPEGNVISLIMNRGLGVALEPTKMNAFINAYKNSERGLLASKLYDGQGNLLGTVLDDISGCHYEEAPNNQSVTIPRQEVNNVYNYYQYYSKGILPDFVNIGTITKSFVLTKIDTTSNNGSALYNAFSSTNFVFGQEFRMSKRYSTYAVYGGDTLTQDCTIYTDDSGMRSICEYFNLDVNKNYISGADILNHNTSMNRNAGLHFRNSNNEEVIFKKYNSSTNTFYDANGYVFQWTIGNSSDKYIPISENGKSVTIYKNSNIYSNVFNHTYTPDVYITQKYLDYNTSTQTDIQTNTNNISNSNENNNNVYNEVSESYSETVYDNDNEFNYVDNTQIITNNTTIINNYYGDNNGGDSGGDSGESGSGSDEDSGILDRLLNALIDFFKMIGKVIAAILTGIVELIDQVLGGLANILTAIDPFNNLLRALFGFLPDIVVNTISLALSICVMLAVLKFLRG